MPFLSWSEKFSIGVNQIDDQHRQLFELINNMYDKIKTDAEHSTPIEALDALLDYTNYHFKEEESFMVKNDYVQYEQHKRVHDNLTKQVIEYKNKFSQGKGDTGEFVRFLFDWLTRHIMDQDKKIGKFMERKLLKPIPKE
ncbi:MAG TPA: bacteriohemerythrin [Spirochaetota bacterium]|nr:bacteriohemerythrin [Spirochaetota bacterium]HPJ34680.1 bacteriohemerythrin [Spirochaetota bacterium]